MIKIDTIYEDMLKHEGFVTAQKLKLEFLGVGVMEDSLLKVFKKNNEFLLQNAGKLDIWSYKTSL